MLALARVLRLLIFNQGDPALVSLAQARGSGKETLPFPEVMAMKGTVTM